MRPYHVFITFLSGITAASAYTLPRISKELDKRVAGSLAACQNIVMKPGPDAADSFLVDAFCPSGDAGGLTESSLSISDCIGFDSTTNSLVCAANVGLSECIDCDVEFTDVSCFCNGTSFDFDSTGCIVINNGVLGCAS